MRCCHGVKNKERTGSTICEKKSSPVASVMMRNLWKKTIAKIFRRLKIPHQKGQRSQHHHQQQQRKKNRGWQKRRILGISTTLVIFVFVVHVILTNRSISTKQKTRLVHNHGPLLLLPSSSSSSKKQGSIVHHQKNQKLNALRKPFRWYRDHWYRRTTLPKTNNNSSNPKTAWQNTQLPLWMKNYFDWHYTQQQQQSISSSSATTTTTTTTTTRDVYITYMSQ